MQKRSRHPHRRREEPTMRDGVLIAVLSFTVIAVLRWVGIWGRDRIDRRKVYCWLRSKTRDEPGESHVETTPLAKATRLPEERVAAGLNVWPANPSSTR